MSRKASLRAPDLIGQTFDALTILSVGDEQPIRWICRCVCGVERAFYAGNVPQGKSRSCGCVSLAKTIATCTTHGQAGHGRASAEYKVWGYMLSRASTGSAKRSRADYLDRGITVCERWLTFENFIADMGTRSTPQHQIDRINNDGNYEPGNCRWATRKEQCRNRRTSRLITHDGVTATVAEWVERTGINQGTIMGRLKRGKSPAEVLAPVRATNTETES